MSNHEKRTLTFKVQSFRRIPNPYLKSEEGEKGAEMYIAICDVKDKLIGAGDRDAQHLCHHFCVEE